MIKQIPFRETVESLKGIRVISTVDFSGYIRSVLIHWPSGCNSLVEIAVGHRGARICPTEEGEYLALDDVTVIFPPSPFFFDEWVDGGDQIWVEMKNGDSANDHKISVVVFIEEIKKE